MNNSSIVSKTGSQHPDFGKVTPSVAWRAASHAAASSYTAYVTARFVTALRFDRPFPNLIANVPSRFVEVAAVITALGFGAYSAYRALCRETASTQPPQPSSGATKSLQPFTQQPRKHVTFDGLNDNNTQLATTSSTSSSSSSTKTNSNDSITGGAAASSSSSSSGDGTQNVNNNNGAFASFVEVPNNNVEDGNKSVKLTVSEPPRVKEDHIDDGEDKGEGVGGNGQGQNEGAAATTTTTATTTLTLSPSSSPQPSGSAALPPSFQFPPPPPEIQRIPMKLNQDAQSQTSPPTSPVVDQSQAQWLQFKSDILRAVSWGAVAYVGPTALNLAQAEGPYKALVARACKAVVSVHPSVQSAANVLASFGPVSGAVLAFSAVVVTRLVAPFTFVEKRNKNETAYQNKYDFARVLWEAPLMISMTHVVLKTLNIPVTESLSRAIWCTAIGASAADQLELL